MNHLKPVALDKAYRIFNLGATALVSAAHEGDTDIMPATWICPLDLDPFLTTAVIDSSHYTRVLMEKSGYFALSLPAKGIARETLYLGSVSKFDEADKLAKSGAKIMTMPGYDIPFVEGSVACAIFEIIPEARNQDNYDLFIGKCVAAWADDRVYNDGHWSFDGQSDDLRPLHYVAGGHFFTTGEACEVEI
ncbi:MAG: flavin reductase family protein [Sutterellaceae bacterium]|nr:flavin reductase family protein [Sutterellaceae bacterium]